MFINQLAFVVGRIMPASINVHFLSSGSYEYAMLHGKEELKLHMELLLLFS
jgi:hypothetical protein